MGIVTHHVVISTFSSRIIGHLVLIIKRFRLQARVVQKVDNAVHRINHYPADSMVCFVDTYPLDSDLSGGWRYPTFEQLGPGTYLQHVRKLHMV